MSIGIGDGYFVFKQKAAYGMRFSDWSSDVCSSDLTGRLGGALTATGAVDFNQRDIAIVQARASGFVSRVYARAPGDVIGAGAPLADLLVPEWAGAQAEYLAVRRTGDTALARAARQRLTLHGMPPGTINARSE